MTIHLGPPLPTGSSSLPEDGAGPLVIPKDHMPSYLALLQVGFGHCRVTTVSRALLPPVFILT